MTSAVQPYPADNSGGEGQATVWGTGLAASLCVHLLILAYGLPELSRPEPVTDRQPKELEILLDEGGLFFEPAAPVAGDMLAEAGPEAPMSSSTAPEEPIAGVAAVIAPIPAPLAVEPVPSIAPEVTVPAPVLADAADPSPSLTPGQTETAGVVDPPLVADTAKIPVPVLQMESVTGIEQTVTALASPDEPLASAAPLVVRENTAQIIVSAADPGSDIAIVAIAPLEGPLAEPGPPVLPDGAAGELIQIVPQSPPAGAIVPDLEPGRVSDPEIPAMVVAAETIPAPMVTDGTAVASDAAPSAPASVVSSAAAGGAVLPSGIPEAVSAPVSSAAEVKEPEIVAEAPAPEQLIASIDPLGSAEPVVPAPAEAETARPAPAVEEPAAAVVPKGVAALDPAERIAAYIADYDAGDCAHMTVQSAGAENAMITAFGASIAPFVSFDSRFSRDQGFDAQIQLRIVTKPQCALLEALGFFKGLEVADLIQLDKTVVRSGGRISGVVERGMPPAGFQLANASPADLGGKGPPELYLVDDAGQIHDGRGFLLPASDPARAGGWRFAIPVTMLSANSEETALVLALWNRPGDRQPASFGSLPSSRIPGVLQHPGIYSLAAFKVTR